MHIQELKIIALIVATNALLTTAALAQKTADPIRVIAPQTPIDFSKTDGGLPRAEGSATFVIARPPDNGGWTYNHHPDIACWKGKLIVAWESCMRDEDTWPSKELYSTSDDGEHWTAPAELFPMGTSTALRMYFYRASNGRMLTIAGLRTSRDQLDEKTKGGLVVREIGADGALGTVFILRQVAPPMIEQPSYRTSTDIGFVQACDQLLADKVFLEQQDYGMLLAAGDRMKWNDPGQWPADAGSRRDIADFGKATCFFRREDGTLVEVCKKGWVTTSTDDGKTWSLPVRPASLITGMGKVWSQRAPGGGYLMAYDPHPSRRYPLVVVRSADGITFSDMKAVHGDLPPMRWPGEHKSVGASYVRGISMWSSDGSRPNDPAWLVFSVNKEEIWIARVPTK